MSVGDTFKKIIIVEIVDLIVRCTNKKAKTIYDNYNSNNPNSNRSWRPVTTQEMYLFIGILIYSRVNNSNTDHTSAMWKSTFYPLYRATMGLNRFRAILRFIRFDDANTRQARTEQDNAALTRDVWTMLNSNLSKMYKPTENVTIVSLSRAYQIYALHSSKELR